jgi:hypothetical protein
MAEEGSSRDSTRDVAYIYIVFVLIGMVWSARFVDMCGNLAWRILNLAAGARSDWIAHISRGGKGK